MTFQTRALDLARALIEGTRNNGDTFYYLAGMAPAWMHEAVKAAHHDELPNDWRFAMVRQLAFALANYDSADSARDAALDIASDAASPYHSDLLAWYADRPGRLSYADDWVIDYGIDSVDGGIGAQLMAGQAYCIEQMLHGLIDACEARQAELAAV